MIRLQVKYFAQLREQLQKEQESLELDGPLLVSGLIDELRLRGGPWTQALSEGQRICVAVDQEMVPLSYRLAKSAEVALFRPVTGG